MEKMIEVSENNDKQERDYYSEQAENTLHPFIQKIYDLNLPDYAINRTINVLEKIIAGDRVYAIKTDDYEEYISLIDGLITVTQKMIDYRVIGLCRK